MELLVPLDTGRTGAPAGIGLDAVGGKAGNLQILLDADFPVPPGFCLTTTAYRQVVGGSLDDLMPALTSPHAEQSAAEARRRVLTRPVPEDIRDALLSSYHALGDAVPVAVRSSATAEDLAHASFAGQQDTILEVVGDSDLLAAVRRCWASLWTDRAVAYRNAQGIDHHRVALAVVVQVMVDARVAGVMFTANPITGTRRETVIDASPGLGEAVVSGAVDPDHFVVDADAAAVLTRRLAGEVACLTDEEVLELAALGRRVQDHYGAPQDTEWAIDQAGRAWLTQSRAVTTLYPLVTSDRPGDRIFLCLTLAQGLTRPITPAGLAAFGLIAGSVGRAAGRPAPGPEATPWPFRVAGQRVFVDVTGVIGSPLGRRLAGRMFSVMEARTATVLGRVVTDPRFPIRTRSPLPLLRPVARVAVVRAKFPVRMAVALLSPRAARVQIGRLERRLRVSLSWPDVEPEERLDRVRARLGHDLFLLMPSVFAYAAAGFVALGIARRLLGDRAEPDELQTVMRGLPDNVTTEMDLQLWRLTEAIRADRAAAGAFATGSVAELTAAYRSRTLPPVAQRELTAFLRQYGHRAVAEIDLGMPRWSDDPGHLVGMVVNYLRLTDPTRAPEAQFRASATSAEAMLAELVDRLLPTQPVRARVVRWALSRARALAGLRESPKNLLVLALSALRGQLREVGDALVARGAIQTEDDVFFLDFDDMAAGLDGRSLHTRVAERREAYARELRRRHIPRMLLSDGTEPEAVAESLPRPDGALAGSPASPGTVTGPARVVLDPVGAHLEPGEILIAPSTDPGWTPLFLTAGGLVMEMGGPNSHGAVVAREYGIPAVVGVPDATHRLVTGQLVTVDGASGLVSLVAVSP